MVLPVSLAMTSIRSARCRLRESPTRCRIAARSSPDRRLQAVPAAPAVLITLSRSDSCLRRTESIVLPPRTESGIRANTDMLHSRFAGSDGSVSAVLEKPVVGAELGEIRRSWVRRGRGTSESRSARDAKKRCSSRAKSASFCESSKTADMKLSWLAPSSSRRMR